RARLIADRRLDGAGDGVGAERLPERALGARPERLPELRVLLLLGGELVLLAEVGRLRGLKAREVGEGGLVLRLQRGVLLERGDRVVGLPLGLVGAREVAVSLPLSRVLGDLLLRLRDRGPAGA